MIFFWFALDFLKIFRVDFFLISWIFFLICSWLLKNFLCDFWRFFLTENQRFLEGYCCVSDVETCKMTAQPARSFWCPLQLHPSSITRENTSFSTFENVFSPKKSRGFFLKSQEDFFRIFSKVKGFFWIWSWFFSGF